MIKDYQNFFAVSKPTAIKYYKRDILEILKRHPLQRSFLVHNKVTLIGFRKLYGVDFYL